MHKAGRASRNFHCLRGKRVTFSAAKGCLPSFAGTKFQEAFVEDKKPDGSGWFCSSPAITLLQHTHIVRKRTIPNMAVDQIESYASR